MNAEKIYDILLKFSSNNQRGLLIDGSWGIGKTYQINRFLEKIEADNKKEKDKSKKTKIIYSSLFGLDSIIFGDRTYFQTPKPIKLIKELVRATTNKNSIVLDFFAGSGTTGHAVIDLNKEDYGNRKYILISNNESNICKNVTLKRIKMFDKSINFID